MLTLARLASLIAPLNASSTDRRHLQPFGEEQHRLAALEAGLRLGERHQGIERRLPTLRCLDRFGEALHALNGLTELLGEQSGAAAPPDRPRPRHRSTSGRQLRFGSCPRSRLDAGSGGASSIDRRRWRASTAASSAVASRA